MADGRWMDGFGEKSGCHEGYDTIPYWDLLWPLLGVIPPAERVLRGQQPYQEYQREQIINAVRAGPADWLETQRRNRIQQRRRLIGGEGSSEMPVWEVADYWLTIGQHAKRAKRSEQMPSPLAIPIPIPIPIPYHTRPTIVRWIYLTYLSGEFPLDCRVRTAMPQAQSRSGGTTALSDIWRSYGDMLCYAMRCWLFDAGSVPREAITSPSPKSPLVLSLLLLV